MQLRRIWLVPAAGACAGAAAWFTRAALDVATVQGRDVRVAMFPPLAQVPLLVLLLSLACGIVIVTLARRGSARERTVSRTPDLLFPLFALVVLALPYLPWLPDRLPGLRVFAGPVRGLLWTLVLGQATVSAWIWARRQRSEDRPAPTRRCPPRSNAVRMGVVFLAGSCAFGLVAWQLTSTMFHPSGDEPHYLVVAQSLWRDGDLRIENNHARGDYREYYGRDLEPHFIARGADDQIYSIHPVGLPFLIAPVYAFGGYSAVVGFLILIGAAGGALMWRWAAARTGSRSAATFAWLAVCLSAPYVLNTITVYPEILAGLCVLLVLACDEKTPPIPGPDVEGFRRTLAQGVSIAALPWLSTKYVPMAATLWVIVLWRQLRVNRRLSPKPTAALTIPLAVSGTCWLLFFLWIWGTPAPSAPYGTSEGMSLRTLLSGGPGLLFDQEYGLALCAPALLIGVVGLFPMWRSEDPAERRTAIEIVCTLAALLGTVGAFHVWWGGSSAPGRPIASGLLLLGLPIARQYARSAHEPRRRALYQLLVFLGVAVAALRVFAREGLLLPNDRDGSSRLLEWMSQAWPAWATFPSFIVHPPSIAMAMTLVWAAGCAMAAWFLSDRQRAKRPADIGPGRAALTASVASFIVLMIVPAAISVLFAGTLQAGVPPVMRAEVPLLSRYDATARPVAIMYDPFTRIRAEDVPPLFRFIARAGDRRPTAPRGVVLNARFSLPAGRYALEIVARQAAAGTVALQVGREGPPFARWTAALAAGDPWRTTFALPIDANFVGFDASSAIAQAIAELRVRPIAITDAGVRAGGKEVMAAGGFPSASVFLHDRNGWIEPAGLWTRGRSTTELTVVPEGPARVVLTLRSGPSPTSVVLATAGWDATLTLRPGRLYPVELPAVDRPGGAIQLRVVTTDGFTPATVVPNSRDRRLLGCWIEVGGVRNSAGVK